MQVFAASFPTARPRRLRASELVRRAVAETRLSPEDFIVPVFVKEGLSSEEPIPSMPGYYRWPLAKLADHLSKMLDLGLNKFLLFGIPLRKDELGSSAYDRDGIVQKALRVVRAELGDRVLLLTDVCLCQYTSHGHCGVVTKSRCGGRWTVDNDKSLELMARAAVSHAEAGADVVAPSSMMDGVVGAIRKALDDAGFSDVAIMSYSAKYASGFYGPFREAASSAPRFGDRRGYQMDPRNAFEALKEASLDISEGADILMVKPALAYLDVIRLVKQEFPYVPLAAYNVSGEYSMVKAAAERGWLDEKRVVMEVLTGIRRAGADLIISYHAADVARWLAEGYDPF